MTRKGRLTPVPDLPGQCPECREPKATCDSCLRDTCHDLHDQGCWRNVVPPTG